MKRNVAYQTDQLVRYFAGNRVVWSQFYESERVILSRLNLDSRHTILDIGCGCGCDCGGLGLALWERFGVESNLLQELVAFDPSEINAFGYWGAPSVTTVTPHQQLCFSAFSNRKRSGDAGVVRFDLHRPAEILAIMGFSNQ